MSLEAYALCDRPLHSVAEWQTCIDALGFDLQLRSNRDLATSKGHLPALWRGREAGFECTPFPMEELSATYDDLDFGGSWACVYAFYFSTLPSCAGAWIAVAACISLAGGMAFDTHDGVLLTAEQAMRYAHDTEANVAKLEMRYPHLKPH